MGTAAGLGEQTGGVWTRAQARAAGLSDSAITRRVATGEWQCLRRGVYADGGSPPSPVARGWAGVLACGGPGRAWAAGRTTVRLYRLPLIDDDDPATGVRDADSDDVVVRAGRARRSGTLSVCRFTPKAGDTVLVDGCPTFTLARALPGLAGVVSFEALVCVLDAALHRELLTAEQLAEAVTDAAGSRGCAVLQRATAFADGRAESPHETLLRLLLKPALPGLEPQVRVRNDKGRIIARLDLGDDEIKLAVEGDGKQGHQGSTMAAKDRRRDRTTEAQGWVTERFTWYETRRKQEEMLGHVLAAARRLRAAS